jgi:transketolase
VRGVTMYLTLQDSEEIQQALQFADADEKTPLVICIGAFITKTKIKKKDYKLAMKIVNKLIH